MNGVVATHTHTKSIHILGINNPSPLCRPISMSPINTMRPAGLKRDERLNDVLLNERPTTATLKSEIRVDTKLNRGG